MQDRASGISAKLKQYMQRLQLSGGKRKRPSDNPCPSWVREEPASDMDALDEANCKRSRPKRKQKCPTLPLTRNFSRRRSLLCELLPLEVSNACYQQNDSSALL